MSVTWRASLYSIGIAFNFAPNKTTDPSNRYVIAILLPPLAVFLCGKPVQTLINVVLCLFLWVPGIIHALFVVHAHLADKRTEQIVDAIKDSKDD